MINGDFRPLRAMLLLLPLLLGSLGSLPAHAQNWKWAKGTTSTSRSATTTGTGTAMDAAGNTYVTGMFTDTVTFGTTRLISRGGPDFYVAKLSPTGSWLWAAAGGGVGYDEGGAIGVDANGTNVYVSGTFLGSATFGTTSASGSVNASNVFVARLNAATGAWQNVTAAVSPSSNGSDAKATGLVLDAAGNPYVTGLSWGGTFGATTIAPYGQMCGYVARLSATTLAWQWVVKIDDRTGSYGYAKPLDLAVDASGNVVIGGELWTAATFGTTRLLSAAGPNVTNYRDGFVARLSSAGAWQWATRCGSGDFDGVSSVAVDASGNIYAGGITQDMNVASFGTLTQPATQMGTNAFIARLSPTGTWQWVRSSGNGVVGSSYANTTELRVNAAGDVYAAGVYQNQGTPYFGPTTLTSTGSSRIFLARLSSAGAWQWTESIGEVYSNYPPALALDPATGTGALVGTSVGITPLRFGAYSVAGLYTYGTVGVGRFTVAGSVGVTSFTPATAPVGATVTVTGVGFTGLGTTHVRFNGAEAASVTVNSATSLTAVVPAGATTGPLFVTSDFNGNIGTSATSFTVAANPAITAFSPASGPVGTSVTITGTGLNYVQSVTFNGVNTPFTVLSPTQITTTVPVGASTGKLYLSSGGTILTSATNFTVSPPTVAGFAPVSGAVGTTVTVTGTNFYGVNGVLFGSTYATAYTLVSPTQITAVVPTGAATGKITVLTGAGNALSAANFTVSVPALTSFAPLSGPLGATVTLTGTAFTGATSVRFNGIAASAFTVVSPTSITAVVPAGATTGKVSVTVPTATVLSTANFTITPSVPTLTNFSPATGPVGTVVTVRGTNFTSATQVKFNAAIGTSLTVIDATTLTAVVPTGATTGKVTVTTLGGTVLSTANFNVTTASTATVAQWRADSLAAPAGSQVVVPVRVRGFSGLIGMAGSLTWDASKLVYVGVEQLNTTGLPGLAAASFGTSQTAAGQLRLTWNHASNTSTTLADNTVIFAVRFAVAPATPVSALVLTIPKTNGALEFTRADFSTAPVAAKDGKVMVTAPTTAYTATLSGLVRTSTGTPIGGATLRLKGTLATTPLNPGQTTAAAGTFSFPALLAGAAYTLAPQKSNDVAVTNGITAVDIALMQRHVLGTALLANAYKVVAADVDRSGAVTAADVALVRDLLLGNRTSFPKGRVWTFVRANQTFANQNAPWPIDTARTYTSMATATAQDFVGCKLGDVNDSWNAGIARPATGAAAELRLVAAASSVGQPVRVTPLLLARGTDPHALQTTLTWDPATLRLRTVGHLPAGVVVGQIDNQAGRLPLLWTEPSPTTLNAQGLALAELVFDVLDPHATGLTTVSFADDRLAGLAADNNLSPLALNQTPVSLQLGQRVTGTASALAAPALDWQVWPNPAHDVVRLTGAPGATAALVDAMGRVVRTVAVADGAATLDVGGLPAGVYTVRCATLTRRLVVE